MKANLHCAITVNNKITLTPRLIARMLDSTHGVLESVVVSDKHYKDLLLVATTEPALGEYPNIVLEPAGDEKLRKVVPMKSGPFTAFHFECPVLVD